MAEYSPDPILSPGPQGAAQDAKSALIEALMSLAAERRWEDISIADVAERAGLSLTQFRTHFVSKGAMLAELSKRLDLIVLNSSDAALVDEPAKERLADVLLRRLDAMAPYRAGLKSIHQWARRDPLAATALNRVVINSMRFMLEAAHLESEGPMGALKLQGLVLAWARILEVWYDDQDEGLGATLAALDRELIRGERFVGYARDLDHLAQPLFSIFGKLIAGRPKFSRRRKDRWADEPEDESSARMAD
jgi:AcrR family transcriptional regulator